MIDTQAIAFYAMRRFMVSRKLPQIVPQKIGNGLRSSWRGQTFGCDFE